MDQNREMTFKLPWRTVQIISAALHEMPFRVASPVLAELQKQINEHVSTDNVVSMTSVENADAA